MRLDRIAYTGAASPVANYTVAGEASPDLIDRPTGLFVQRGLTPPAGSMCRDGGPLHVGLVQDDRVLECAIVSAEKMRSIMIVASVNPRHTCSIDGFPP